MTEPFVFRLLFAVLFFTIVGLVVTYRVRANKDRRIDYSKEAPAVLVTLRLSGLVVWLYGPVYVLAPHLLS